MTSCPVPLCLHCNASSQKCLECYPHFTLSEDGLLCDLPAENILLQTAGVIGLVLGAFMLASCIGQVMLVNKLLAEDMVQRVRKKVTRASGQSSKYAHKAQSSCEFQNFKKLQASLVDKEGHLSTLVHGYESWRESLIMDWSEQGVTQDAVDVLPSGRGVARSQSKTLSPPLAQEQQQQPTRLSRFWEVMGTTSTEVAPPPRSFPFWIPVHRLDILGVGLPLFYNFHLLPAVTALLGLLATLYPCLMTFIQAPPGFLSHWGGEAELTREGADRLGNEAVIFSEALCNSIGAMYVLLLGISLAYGFHQRRFYADFDAMNTTEADYTLHLKGLPPRLCEENVLKQEIEEAFREDVYGVSIAYDLTKGDLSDKIGKMVDKVQEEWEDLYTSHKERLMRWAPDASKHFWQLSHSEYRQHCETVRERLRDEADELQRLLDNKELVGSGHAFVVFGSKRSLDRVLRMYRGFWLKVQVEMPRRDVSILVKNALQEEGGCSGRLVASGEMGGMHLCQGTEVKNLDQLQREPLREGGTAELNTFVRACKSSPVCTSVLWYNCGLEGKITCYRIVKAALKVVFAFAVLAAAVYAPLGEYLLGPYAVAAAQPSFTTQQLQGFIFGAVNSILGQIMWQSVSKIGFWNRDQFDAVILVLNIIVTLCNTTYFLGFCLYPAVGGFRAVDLVGEVEEQTALHKLGHQVFIEKHFSERLFDTLMPGWLFSGYFIGQIMGNLMPLVQNTALVLIVYVFGCLPDKANLLLTKFIPYNPSPDSFTKLQAERVFQPKFLALAWDYANLLIMPTMCILTLFILSPHMWRIFPVMLGWVGFVYLFHRQVILRLSKTQLHASTQLDVVALHLWGFPLSLLAAAWAFWSMRLGLIANQSVIPVVVFFISFFCYSATLNLFGVVTDTHHFLEADMPYERMASKIQYSWFNANPVRVLQCALLPPWKLDSMLSAARAPIPFAFGKEYLQPRVCEHSELPDNEGCMDSDAGFHQ